MYIPKQKNIYYIEFMDTDFQKTLNKFLNSQKDVCYYLEQANDSVINCKTDVKEFCEYDRKYIEELRESDNSDFENYMCGTVLTAMAKEGLIPEGEYNLQICW